MYLVTGLGNPGIKYLKNLHNIGFMAVELLAEKYGAEFKGKGFNGLYAEKIVEGEKVFFLKPQTFMNLSGQCVAAFSSYFKIPPENIVVIYDDVDIEIGALRVRPSGSAGTHNGMRNIVAELGTENFPRIRVGTKPEGEVRADLMDYVLSDIKKEDEPRFAVSIKAAVAAADDFIHGKNIEEIMCEYNGGRRGI